MTDLNEPLKVSNWTWKENVHAARFRGTFELHAWNETCCLLMALRLRPGFCRFSNGDSLPQHGYTDSSDDCHTLGPLGDVIFEIYTRQILSVTPNHTSVICENMIHLHHNLVYANHEHFYALYCAYLWSVKPDHHHRTSPFRG